jgi:hypothetical protein
MPVSKQKPTTQFPEGSTPESASTTRAEKEEVFLRFDLGESSSGGRFFLRFSSFLRSNLCLHESFFLFDQVLCSTLASLVTYLLDIFTQNSGWHPQKSRQ